MLASVIICNFNYGRYVGAAIESALRQNYSDIEVLVVDDGSTDNSREVIDQYADCVTRIYRKNGGQCASCNSAFRESRGDIVIFLDADDVLLPDAVALHARSFQDTRVVKSVGYLQAVDDGLRPLGYRIPGILPDSGDYRPAFLARGPAAYQSAFTSGNAWSRVFLDKVMPLPTHHRIIGVDAYLNGIDALFGRIQCIDSIVGLYRLHAHNKGPLSKVYSIDTLQRRVSKNEERIRFAEEWAARQGYSVNKAAWMRNRDWKVLLASQLLYLEGRWREPISLFDLTMSPVRSRSAKPISAIGTALTLGLLRLLPKRVSLLFGHRLLRRAMGRMRLSEARASGGSSAPRGADGTNCGPRARAI